jgi:hypothetical protein
VGDRALKTLGTSLQVGLGSANYCTEAKAWLRKRLRIGQRRYAANGAREGSRTWNGGARSVSRGLKKPEGVTGETMWAQLALVIHPIVCRAPASGAAKSSRPGRCDPCWALHGSGWPAGRASAEPDRNAGPPTLSTTSMQMQRVCTGLRHGSFCASFCETPLFVDSKPLLRSPVTARCGYILAV